MIRRGHRYDHGELLDRLGAALALVDRWPSESNREIAEAAHLDAIDSALRWGQGGKGVVRVVPWR